jgi:NAD(P)-dependent dehydrogenase (short-subunit alcohol dehydrogenase family)
MRDQIAHMERATIAAVLESCSGSQTEAAKQLGISRRTLICRMEKHGLSRRPGRARIASPRTSCLLTDQPRARPAQPNPKDIPMKSFQGRTAVITGAGSGFGLEVCRIAAAKGMRVVMAEIQQDALDATAAEITKLGAQVLPYRLDVSNAAEVEALGAATRERFGAPHVVFNNAGVGSGGLIWEMTVKDWDWVLGVNVMGVVHGVRVFTPMMLEAARRDAAYEGHIVNTASMAGLLNPPNMGVYNVSKHAVVSLSETLYHDLCLVTDQVRASVLCPYFVPTGITHSERNRPANLQSDEPTRSQLVAKAMSDKAVSSGRVTAATVAQFVFDAIAESRFYIYSHPHALGNVQARMEDIVAGKNPSDPFAQRPEVGELLRNALRAEK